MFKQIKSFGPIAISVALIAILLLGSVVPAKADSAKSEIPVGYRIGWTGPLASLCVPFGMGGLDYLKYQNDYKGGINGIPIKIMWEDDHSEATKEISIHKRFVAAGVVLEISVLSGAAMYTVALQERDEIPLISSEIDEGTRTEPHWVLGTVPTWNCLTATMIRWVKENWTEARQPRVGHIGINQPMAYASIEGIPEFCHRNGVEWVGYEVVPLFGCIDTSVELLRLAAKKPDWVYVCAYAAPLVTTIKDAARLELQQKGIRFCGSPQAIDEVIINTTGAAAAEGWCTLRALPSPWEDEFVGGIKCPGMIEVREAAKKYRDWGLKEMPGNYSVGWLYSAVGCEAIRIALEKVGIENLTGRAVRDGLFSIKDFDSRCLPFPVNTSEEKPYVAEELLVYQVKQGKIIAIAPPAPIPSPAAQFGIKL